MPMLFRDKVKERKRIKSTEITAARIGFLWEQEIMLQVKRVSTWR